MHWIGDPVRWLSAQKSAGTAIVGVELCDEAIPLVTLPAARGRTVVVLGHEQTGIPSDAMELLDIAVEIPMMGSGSSLNVAVSGSLIAYKLAGLV